MESLLTTGAAELGLTLSPSQLAQFDNYSQLLIEWNQKFNLTRIIEPDEIVVKHFLDSLSVGPLLADLPGNFTLVDVGSGPGFPGLPLKIALPQLRLTLVESTGKKAGFLQHVVDALKLDNVRVVTARAEEAGQQPRYREKFDVAVARAVARLGVLAEYTLPLVKIGGRVIAQKGQLDPTEVNDAGRAVKLLGGKLSKPVPVSVPGLEAERHLVVINKVKRTPKLYPRRPGLPAKEPL